MIMKYGARSGDRVFAVIRRINERGAAEWPNAIMPMSEISLAGRRCVKKSHRLIGLRKVIYRGDRRA